MRSNKTKYLIFILVALFFASTSELSEKESERNYKTENHAFITTDNFVLSIHDIVFQNFKSKKFAASPSFNYLVNFNYDFKYYPKRYLISIPPLIAQAVYLNNSTLLI